MQKGQDVRKHMSKFFDLIEKLGNMGVEIKDNLLYSLPENFGNFRCAI